MTDQPDTDPTRPQPQPPAGPYAPPPGYVYPQPTGPAPASYPYPPPYPPSYPPPPQRQGLSQKTIAIATVGTCLIFLGVIAFGALWNRGTTSKMDVEVTSCEFTSGGILPSATVGYTVTNNGNSTRSVRLSVEYRDGSGARIDTDTAWVRDVKPGDTVRGEEVTLLDATPSGSGECLIVDVDTI